MTEKIKTFINIKKGEKQSFQNQYDEISKKVISLSKEVKRTEQAQVIIQEVAKITQEKIKFFIEDIITTTLDAVFPDEYEFKMEFVNKRNKTECDIFLLKDGKRFYPVDDNGGGVVDIVSFALRIALWNIKKGNKLNTIILDEPFRFISRDLKPRAIEILKELSIKLHIQFIVVTHDPDIIEIADRSFLVKKDKKISKVEQI